MSEGSLEPTPKRLEKARREGDFGASGAPGSALSLFAAVLALPSLGLFMASELRTSIRAATGYASLVAPDPSLIGAREIAAAVLMTSLPLVALVAGIAGTGTALETRFGFSVARLGGRGSARGSRSFTGPFVRGLLGATFALTVTLVALRASGPAVAHASAASPDGLVTRLAGVVAIPLRVGVVLALLGAMGSTFFAVRAHRQKLRMTPRQVEDERKQGEGDPDVKAARKRVAETIFSSIPLSALPTETSACVFDRDIAVIVSWNKDVDAAPRLLHKLRGKDADRLVREATLVGIRTTPDAELVARLATLTTGSSVPESLYDPVATLFASNI